MDWQSIGRMFIGLGILLFIVGVVLFGLGKLFHLGSLPGDVVFKRGSFTFYFPLVSCIIISIVLTILLNLIFRR